MKTNDPYRIFPRATERIVEQWRPIVVFGKHSGVDLPIRDTLNNTKEKDHHDWQQSLPVALELMGKLSKPGGCDLRPSTR